MNLFPNFSLEFRKNFEEVSSRNLTMHLRCSIDNNECSIILKGNFTRNRCFDSNGPFILEIPRYYCKDHDKTFNLLNEFHFQLLNAKNINCINKFVVFDRAVVTISLVNKVMALFLKVDDRFFIFKY